jgi:serine phosphatase RsbU (regulator of sigma subunit)
LNKIKQLSDENLKQTKRELDLRIESEKQKVLFQEADYRAKVAELQANAIALENERKTKELESARKLQLSMLPKDIPVNPSYSIAAKMITATEVGGDFYDFTKLNTQEMLVAIGDATGHGLSAGTMVTAVKALFRSAPQMNTTRLPELLNVMTLAIKQLNFKKIFMSLTLAKLSPNGITLSSAGMPGALLYKADEKKLEEIVLKGMPVGSVKNYPYAEAYRSLYKDDVILFYSDGISELFNEKREHFDTPRIKCIFAENCHKTPEEIIQSLLIEADLWRGTTQQHDDITLLVVKKN